MHRAVLISLLALGLSACASTPQDDSVFELIGSVTKVDESFYWTGTDEASVDLYVVADANAEERAMVAENTCKIEQAGVRLYTFSVYDFQVETDFPSLKRNPGTSYITSYSIQACEPYEIKDP